MNSSEHHPVFVRGEDLILMSANFDYRARATEALTPIADRSAPPVISALLRTEVKSMTKTRNVFASLLWFHGLTVGAATAVQQPASRPVPLTRDIAALHLPEILNAVNASRLAGGGITKSRSLTQ